MVAVGPFQTRNVTVPYMPELFSHNVTGQGEIWDRLDSMDDSRRSGADV